MSFIAFQSVQEEDSQLEVISESVTSTFSFSLTPAIDYLQIGPHFEREVWTEMENGKWCENYEIISECNWLCHFVWLLP